MNVTGPFPGLESGYFKKMTWLLLEHMMHLTVGIRRQKKKEKEKINRLILFEFLWTTSVLWKVATSLPWPHLLTHFLTCIYIFRSWTVDTLFINLSRGNLSMGSWHSLSTHLTRSLFQLTPFLFHWITPTIMQTLCNFTIPNKYLIQRMK